MKIEKRHRTGQPILIGTASVAESERLADLVKEQAMICDVLNARHDATEAEIIARAGRVGAITISTNMAGRGVDIRLEQRDGPGLLVIGTKPPPQHPHRPAIARACRASGRSR